MKRIAAHRTLAMLMAMVFLLTGAGDLFGVHPCPHHDPLAAIAAEHADAHHHPAPADAPAEADHHDGAPAAPEAEHASCTCVGVCPTSSGIALTVEVRHAVTTQVVAAPAAAIEAADVAVARFLPYVLPYAQAPPLAG